ncbi:unnamed protein product, partial [Dovyalis caffra]
PAPSVKHLPTECSRTNAGANAFQPMPVPSIHPIASASPGVNTNANAKRLAPMPTPSTGA